MPADVASMDIWATAIRNASIVDVAWSLCFTVIAVLIWWKATGDGFEKHWFVR